MAQSARATGYRAPATRRAETSHQTVSTPKAAMKKRAFHLVPRAAAEQHTGHDAPRPEPQTGAEVAALELGRAVRPRVGVPARGRGRGHRTRPAGRTTTGRSSSAVRLMTRCRPSIASRKPAMVPEHRRPGHPSHEPGQQQDAERAEHGDRDPPAERVQAEDLLAARDDPLAEWRVDDVRRRVGEHVEVAAAGSARRPCRRSPARTRTAAGRRRPWRSTSRRRRTRAACRGPRSRRMPPSTVTASAPTQPATRSVGPGGSRRRRTCARCSATSRDSGPTAAGRAAPGVRVGHRHPGIVGA